MATTETIKAILKTIRAAYPGRFEIAEDTVTVWASFVQDIEDELLKAAVARFISSAAHAFPPSLPEIRSQATEIKCEVAGIPTEWEAWEDVLRAPRPNGLKQFRVDAENPDGAFFDAPAYPWRHPIVEQVARQFGWHRGMFPGANLETDRAHFVKAYKLAVEKLLKAETQIPAVNQYIDAQRGRLALGVGDQIKQLAKARTA